MQTKEPQRALWLSTMAMAASFVIWNVFSPIAGHVQELYQLSTVQISILIATPVLMGSLMRIPMGIFTDRYGGRRMFLGTMLFLLVPLLIVGSVQSYSMLLVCALLLGMAGSTFAISLTYVSRWFPAEKQGLVLGIAGLGNLGVAGASVGVPLLLRTFNYTFVYYSLALMIGVMALVFWFGTKDYPAPGSGKTWKQAMEVLKYRTTLYLSLFYFLTFGGFVTFSLYLPTFLKELFGLNLTDAGFLTGGFVLLATLIRPVGGYLADRFGSRRVLTAVFIGIALTASLLAVSLYDLAWFCVGCLLASLLLGIGNGGVFQMVPEVASGNTGAVTGIVGAAGGIGGFFPPIVLGVLQDAYGSYVFGFILMLAVAVVCLWLNWSIRPRNHQSDAREGMTVSKKQFANRAG